MSPDERQPSSIGPGLAIQHNLWLFRPDYLLRISFLDSRGNLVKGNQYLHLKGIRSCILYPGHKREKCVGETDKLNKES